MVLTIIGNYISDMIVLARTTPWLIQITRYLIIIMQ